MNSFFLPKYGFLFKEETSDVPGLGEMVTILAPGQELAKQREALGLTQQQVADRARINIRQYQRLESGERSLDSTSFRIGLNVCYALQIDPMFYCEAYYNEKNRNLHDQARKKAEHMEKPSDVTSPVRKQKYVAYRENEDGTSGEIIDVEFGTGIDAVYDQIVQAIRDDLSEDPKYAGCAIDVYPCERLQDHRYSIQAAVLVPNAPLNDVIDYLVLESEKD